MSVHFPPSNQAFFGAPSANHTVAFAILMSLALLVPVGSVAAKSGGAAPTVILTGTSQISEADVRAAAAGRMRGKEEEQEWADRAIGRIVRLYAKRGYGQARGWARVELDKTVSIHVDEGVMTRIVFLGAGAYRGALYRVDLNLPGDVFNAKLLDKALQELKTKHHLLGITYRVVETEYLIAMPLGHLAPVRELRIHVVAKESFGWGFDFNMDSSWGPVLQARFSAGSLLLDKDRLRTAAFVAIPYRSFLFSAMPHLTWVHSELDLAYRLPPFASGLLAPQIESETGFSQYSRTIPEIGSAYVLRTSVMLGLAVLSGTQFEGSVGAGPEFYRFFGDDRTKPFLPTLSDPEATADRWLLRFTVGLSASWNFSPDVLRDDMRDGAWIEFRNSVTESGGWLGALDLANKTVWTLGANVLMLRAKGILRLGDVRFFDEASLGGTYLRTFFDGRYWVREAVQVETQFRLAVYRDSTYVGFFNDISVFGDRSEGSTQFGAADAFGPSLHFMYFDRFAVDLYYGLGFAPIGFSQSFSFEAGTVF